MTLVSNDPAFWPAISFFRQCSYFLVASLVVVVYDLALTFEQEFQLVWRQRWSLMTVLYLSVRYAGVLFAVINMLSYLPSVSLTDAVCTILIAVLNWTGVVVTAMLFVILIARLHAMYQQSRKMLFFLIVTFLGVQITCVVIVAIQGRYISGEEIVLSGTYQCNYDFEGDAIFLAEMTWILVTAWEILAMCLVAWVAVKHFRELQRSATTTWTATDCFAVLIKTHTFYFASFVVVSTLQLSFISPGISNSTSVAAEIFGNTFQIFRVVQTFILGPRLILGVREFHAKLVANADSASRMTSIAFQDIPAITDGDV